MEKFSNNPSERSQVLDHASLVASLDKENPDEETLGKIKAIEEQLGLTGEEIAAKALQIYNKSYGR